MLAYPHFRRLAETALALALAAAAPACTTTSLGTGTAHVTATDGNAPPIEADASAAQETGPADAGTPPSNDAETRCTDLALGDWVKEEPFTGSPALPTPGGTIAEGTYVLQAIRVAESWVGTSGVDKAALRFSSGGRMEEIVQLSAASNHAISRSAGTYRTDGSSFVYFASCPERADYPWNHYSATPTSLTLWDDDRMIYVYGKL